MKNVFGLIPGVRPLYIEKLIAPSFPGEQRNYPKWLPPFLKAKLLDFTNLKKPTRRLFISRYGCKRNISNEKSIEDILLKYNFEIYRPTKNENPPQDFSEAKIVIGPHGAGLSDIVFCQPGAKFIELIPTDHVIPYFYTLANATGLKYGCLVCQSEGSRRENAFGSSPYNFYVDENEMEKMLSSIENL